MEPIDLLQRDERAAAAQDLLDNPLLQTVLETEEREAMDRLFAVDPGSPVAMAAHLRVLAIRALRADLFRLVEDPKMLRAAIERRRRMSQ